MAGGVTVPGNMNIQGELNWSGNLPRFGPAENKFTFHTPPDARKGLWIAPSTDDANSNWAYDKALNLNRSGNHNLGGNLNMSGNLSAGGLFQSGLNDIPSIQFPTKNTKINALGIQFGGTNEGHEPNSAQISAGIHEKDSLCIVGMGKNAPLRKINMWAEGGAKINGSLNVTGNLTMGEGEMNSWKGRWWKVVNNIDMPGGDITDFNCGSLNEGIVSCIDRFPHTMAVGFMNNKCWCKNHHANAQPRDGWKIAVVT